jgi:hypothetical protein
LNLGSCNFQKHKNQDLYSTWVSLGIFPVGVLSVNKNHSKKPNYLHHSPKSWGGSPCCPFPGNVHAHASQHTVWLQCGHLVCIHQTLFVADPLCPSKWVQKMVCYIIFLSKNMKVPKRTTNKNCQQILQKKFGKNKPLLGW